MPHRRPITPPNEAQLVRLTKQQIIAIHEIARQLAGADAEVRLFGSRIDDAARGGDVDLLLDLPSAVDNPAMLAARLSAKVSRVMGGRRVDVVIKALNLKQLPIHEVAVREGQIL
jgi:predicted nucleotidyltransferase